MVRLPGCLYEALSWSLCFSSCGTSFFYFSHIDLKEPNRKYSCFHSSMSLVMCGQVKLQDKQNSNANAIANMPTTLLQNCRRSSSLVVRGYVKNHEITSGYRLSHAPCVTRLMLNFGENTVPNVAQVETQFRLMLGATKYAGRFIAVGNFDGLRFEFGFAVTGILRGLAVEADRRGDIV